MSQPKERPNLDYIKEIAAGDSDFEKELLGVIKAEFPVNCKDFHRYFTENNYLEASRIVHKIKHQIGILNMPTSVALASTFESDLKLQKTQLFQEFDLILGSTAKFLAEL